MASEPAAAKPRGRRRPPLALAAWAGATAVASGVAWLGVDSVLIPAAETPPGVLAAGAHTAQPLPALPVTSTPPSSPSPSAIPSPGKSASAGHPPGTSPSARPSAPASPSPSPTNSLKRYETTGGVVVLAIGAHSVKLVSATPAPGFSVQNWSADGWLRVDFSQDSTTYSVFATWNGYSPQVQVVDPG
ncbi:MAG TPA: hypothetical protein VGS97_24800 [Actinocrinis sp.]|uniref:hypothetical protein n=1 Tax=Actinocrinis sp. TaxID=1920516 RepID=UPI002DDCE851|nr:hypothetical protein [Actinocrinis sp.]HEV2347337.1 hypothetical protein [Actinocrinis sp.]